MKTFTPQTNSHQGSFMQNHGKIKLAAATAPIVYFRTITRLKFLICRHCSAWCQDLWVAVRHVRIWSAALNLINTPLTRHWCSVIDVLNFLSSGQNSRLPRPDGEKGRDLLAAMDGFLELSLPSLVFRLVRMKPVHSGISFWFKMLYQMPKRERNREMIWSQSVTIKMYIFVLLFVTFWSIANTFWTLLTKLLRHKSVKQNWNCCK